MLREQPWLKVTSGFEFEKRQAEEEGKDVAALEGQIDEILAMDDKNSDKILLAGKVYDEIRKLPVRSGFKYVEPSGLEEIKAVRPSQASVRTFAGMNAGMDYDKVYGAWLGRCAGCLLGKPVEGWKREQIVGLCRETGNYPFNFYISSEISKELREKYAIVDKSTYDGSVVGWINNVNFMPEDDDINYTIIGLKILETYGRGFTPDDVAESWLKNLPILHTCTAERVAYRNVTAGIYPPDSAEYRNPFREWIGAQIRADFFGYITPGNPELGAEYAWRDASISHTKNGIYGEMFIAAMLSAAAVVNEIDALLDAGLSQIPESCRLAENVKLVREWHKEGITWEAAIDRIHSMYDQSCTHDWCHTISNAMLVCIALLWGGKDLEKTIGIAVISGFDTDCNGATAGSIIGMVLGAKALPAKWLNPLNDTVKSGVDGFGTVKISELAKRTLEI